MIRKIMLAGATGSVGLETLIELKARGYEVTALTRRAAPASSALSGTPVFIADATRPETMAGCCQGVDAVVSALGATVAMKGTAGQPSYAEVDFLGNLNLLNEAKKAGVRKFVYVSLHGAQFLPGISYVKAHEDFVEALKRSGVNYCVIRPTGFFSAFLPFLDLAKNGVMMQIGKGDKRSNPIHERDVAKLCVDSLNSDQREINAGGPKAYTRDAILACAFRAVGKKSRILHMPVGLFRFLSRPVALWDKRLSDVLKFYAAVTQLDLVAPAVGTLNLEDYFKAWIQSAGIKPPVLRSESSGPRPSPS